MYMHAWNAPKVDFHQSYVSVPDIFPHCISMFQVYYMHQDIVSAFKYIVSMYVIVVTPYQNQVTTWATLTAMHTYHYVLFAYARLFTYLTAETKIIHSRADH